MFNKIWILAIVLPAFIVSPSRSEPRLGLYFDQDAGSSFHVFPPGSALNQATLHILAEGVEAIDGAEFMIGPFVCFPFQDMVVDMPGGVIEGTSETGLTVAFASPLAEDPPGYFHIGTLEAVYFYTCFDGPSFGLTILPLPDAEDVMIHDPVAGGWLAAEGGTATMTHGETANERASLGSIKSLYR